MFKKIKTSLFSGTSRDSFIVLTGSAGMAIGGMLFTIFMARSLSPSEFGLFSALMALVILLAGIGEVGISASLIYFLPKLKNNRAEIVSTAFWVQLVSALVLTSVMIFLSIFKQKIIPNSNFSHFLLASSLVFVYILEEFPLAILQAGKKFVLFSLFRFLDSLIKVSVLGLFFLKQSITIEMGIAATLLSASTILLLALRFEAKNITPIFPKIYFRKIFHFAKWIALKRIFSVAFSRVDVILLSALSGNFSAGIFSAAARFSLIFSIIVSSLGNVTAPRFSIFKQKKEIKAYIKKLLLLITAISLGIAPLAIFAKPLINLVFGSEYNQAIPVFQMMVIFSGIPFLYSLVTTMPLIYSFNKPNFVAFATIAQVAVLVILDMILIPTYDAFAPPIALGISNLFILIVTGLKLKSLLK